jgi:replicative DNA helicase
MTAPAKRPLADLDLERSVLAAIALSSSVLPRLVVDEQLSAEAFYSGEHRRILGAMLALHDAGDPVDGHLVAARLAGDEPALRALSNLWGPVPGVANVRAYARRLRELARWRAVHQAGVELEQAALAHDRERMEKAEMLLAGRDERSTATLDEDALRHLLCGVLDSPDPEGFPFPFRRLTELSGGGMRRGETTLLGGWTSHGKSVLLDMLLERCAKAGARCHLYANEMTVEARGLRQLARMSGVAHNRLRSKQLEDDHMRKVVQTLNAGLPFGITQCSGWSAADIARDLRWRRYDVVGVDILHLIPHRDERDLAEISQTLTTAAKVAGSHLIATVHLNEERAKTAVLPPPVLRDIRGSGMLKNDGDNVLFVHREQQQSQSGNDAPFVPGDEGGIYFAKGRSGELGGIPVIFDGRRMRFLPRELVEHREEAAF